MTQTANKVDRYISFENIDCDDRACRIVSHIRSCIADTSNTSHWNAYFDTKLKENFARGHDELYFVGSQVNNIRELFELHEDEPALDLLDQIEEECL